MAVKHITIASTLALIATVAATSPELTKYFKSSRTDWYIIHGVDRKTKADRTVRIAAESAENAKVKAELDDVTVTSVAKD